jgi:hypothetical protein
MTFDEKERSILARLADVLIPAGAGAPSASEAGVAGEGLDKVLTVRADLGPVLKSVLQSLKGRDPAESIAPLQADQPESFAALAEVVAGAYFMNPSVRRAIGYHGQGSRPVDSRPESISDGLLQSVVDRGRIYRPTPGIKRSL